MSELLSISFKRSEISDLFVIPANSSQKTSDSLGKNLVFHPFYAVALRSGVFLKEPKERFALITL